MGFFIRAYFLNCWSYIKSAMSIFIGNLTQFNFVNGIFLLTCIVFEIFRKNWKNPPSNAPPAPRSPPTGGDFQYVVPDIPLYNSAEFQNYTIFFSIFAILTGLLGTTVRRSVKELVLLCVSLYINAKYKQTYPSDSINHIVNCTKLQVNCKITG